MSTDATLVSRMVVVAVDCHSHLPPVIEVAIALANAQRLAVYGLCIEDADLVSVSRLPFTQEITLSGAKPRALQERDLQRTLAGFSRRFRQLLADRAEQAAVKYSFDRVHGRRQAMDIGGPPHSDYLVLGQR
ncbi:MAG: hypothetical protein HKN19_11760, partial [Halioglobus sp.]|nr:hypothetical protein [Halioglobus sp.]